MADIHFYGPGSSERMREAERAVAERVKAEMLRMMNMSGFGIDEPKRPPFDAARLDALKGVEPHRVTQRAPDLLEVITGWRAWAVTYTNKVYRLKALGKSHVWEPKQMVDAVCDGGGSHPAPRQDCNCGVWAFKDLDRLTAALQKYSDIKVLGTVSLWGRVIETENGYRAQYAYPSELWLFDESLEELGLIYDVPVRTA